MWAAWVVSHVSNAGSRLIRRQKESRRHESDHDNVMTSPTIEVTVTSSPRTLTFEGADSDPTAASMPLLYALSRQWAWPAVTFRCHSHPHEASATVRDHNGDTALHWACFGHPPFEPIRALLAACPDLAATPNFQGLLPLHVACSYRASGQVIRHLVQAYPEGVCMASSSGSCPLHFLCDYGSSVDSMQALLETQAGVQVASRMDRTFNRNPLCILNARKSMTEFHNAICTLTRERLKQRQRVEALRDWGMDNIMPPIDDARQLQEVIASCESLSFWQKACLLVRAEYTGRIQNINATDQNLIIHACVGIEACPPSLVEFAMLLYPDQLLEADEAGRLPLHIASSMASDTNLLDILSACPDAAKVRDHRGKLPLEIAIASGHGWTDGVCHLLLENSVALETMDIEERLYPLIWSRLCQIHHRGVNALFESVQAKPSMFRKYATTMGISDSC